VHPFYGPSSQLLARRSPGQADSVAGLVSMAAYLAFWAGALALAWRELDARFPRVDARARDPAVQVLRERFARGEIDADQLRGMRAVLDAEPGRAP
jgi:putative membrane protein